jgi:hypothetical protein
METMDELKGYLSPVSDQEVNSSPMEDSSDDEDMPPLIQHSVAAEKTKLAPAVAVAPVSAAVLKKYDFIPMRLTETERRMLQVLENALEVCEYTDVVDVTFSHTKKSKLSRILESLVDILSISCGLLVSGFTLPSFSSLGHFLTALFFCLYRWQITCPRVSSW